MQFPAVFTKKDDSCLLKHDQKRVTFLRFFRVCIGTEKGKAVLPELKSMAEYVEI